MIFDLKEENDDDEDDDDELEIMNYMRRLEGGLFTLQLTVYVILDIGTNGAPTVRIRSPNVHDSNTNLENLYSRSNRK
jgi:hypothetical protein